MATLSKKIANLEGFTSELSNRSDFNGTSSPMWIFDPRTLVFLAVNNAAVRDYGYSREQFLSMTILDIRPAEDVIPVLRTELREGKRNSGQQVSTLRKKDGSLIDVEVSGREMTFNDRPAQMVIAREISQKSLPPNLSRWPWVR